MRRSLPQQIATAVLKDYLESGVLNSGDRLPSVRELEQQYRASRSTILAALGILEQQGAIVRRHGLGCFVAEDAPRASSMRPPHFLGYISPSTDSELMLRIYEGVEEAARRYDLHVLVASVCHDYNLERKQVARMIEAGCGAIVLSPTTRTPQQLAEDYLNHEFLDFPIVLVDLAYPQHKRPRVVFDNYHAGYDVTTTLLRAGHTRIAIMRLNPDPEAPFACRHYAVEERFRGYCDALRQAHIPLREEYVWTLQSSAFHSDLDADHLERLLALPHPPTALIALEDIAAMSVTELLLERGVQVPEEITVTGFDNLLPARNFHPAFPTTFPDFRKAGELATWLAYSLMKGETLGAITYMLPVPLCNRRLSLKRRHFSREGVGSADA
ncbi:transcriptional regulator [Chthonomonas calidirosea]|uniref:Transcriptional regulator, GntR family n=1 Tax=Chthonomonas calidirosea (strain DSM 23976 / ICMP 18418 / T49) TaxID=1303518 RepID=S0EXR4_CHTCT|nr:GntR family transcriptional regulator [Chthonomonas calidirosea]CCW36292.1 transcriptional regulator, GntR family [Chthonomonas calidirosea T49]CEK17764.1 transcriptional regulator [Chthonomonas calidirosea]